MFGKEGKEAFRIPTSYSRGGMRHLVWLYLLALGERAAERAREGACVCSRGPGRCQRRGSDPSRLRSRGAFPGSWGGARAPSRPRGRRREQRRESPVGASLRLEGLDARPASSPAPEPSPRRDTGVSGREEEVESLEDFFFFLAEACHSCCFRLERKLRGGSHDTWFQFVCVVFQMGFKMFQLSLYPLHWPSGSQIVLWADTSQVCV